MLFGESRQDTRSVFFNAWRKYQDKQPLEGVESIIVQVVLNHPEYHSLLENPDQFQDKDYLPEHGETNPFLLQPDFDSFLHLKNTWDEYKRKHGIK